MGKIDPAIIKNIIVVSFIDRLLTLGGRKTTDALVEKCGQIACHAFHVNVRKQKTPEKAPK